MKNRLIILWGGLLLVVIFWSLYPLILEKYIALDNNRGLFGDSFGALNSLFSGFAFALLIYSIFQQNEQLKMQQEELSLQRKELELTRAELKRSATAQESTEISIRNQAKLMEYSSRLDGLKTLLETYSLKAKSSQNTYQIQQQFVGKVRAIEREIEVLIENLSELIK